MPRYGRITPLWALSFGAILPHLRWCVHARRAAVTQEPDMPRVVIMPVDQDPHTDGILAGNA
jgi:hypothetical protein